MFSGHSEMGGEQGRRERGGKRRHGTPAFLCLPPPFLFAKERSFARKRRRGEWMR